MTQQAGPFAGKRLRRALSIECIGYQRNDKRHDAVYREQVQWTDGTVATVYLLANEETEQCSYLDPIEGLYQADCPRIDIPDKASEDAHA